MLNLLKVKVMVVVLLKTWNIAKNCAVRKSNILRILKLNRLALRILRHANLQTNRLEIFIFLCPEDSNCCALLNHNFVVSLTLVRLHARLSCASPPASLTDESLMHMASEAIQCEFGIIVGKLLLVLEVAKCRHRSTHGARRQVSGLGK